MCYTHKKEINCKKENASLGNWKRNKGLKNWHKCESRINYTSERFNWGSVEDLEKQNIENKTNNCNFGRTSPLLDVILNE